MVAGKVRTLEHLKQATIILKGAEWAIGDLNTHGLWNTHDDSTKRTAFWIAMNRGQVEAKEYLDDPVKYFAYDPTLSDEEVEERQLLFMGARDYELRWKSRELISEKNILGPLSHYLGLDVDKRAIPLIGITADDEGFSLSESHEEHITKWLTLDPDTGNFEHARKALSVILKQVV